jgi:hypothetical protein
MFQAVWGAKRTEHRGRSDDRRSARAGSSRLRGRFRVEPLEPRWLLSATGSRPADPTLLPPFVPMIDTALAPSGPDRLPSDSDMASAELLPDVPSVLVQGSLRADHASAMVKVPLDPGSTVLDLRLTSAAPGKPLGGWIEVFDRHSHLLASASADAIGRAVDIPLRFDGSRPSMLYVQVALPVGTGAVADPPRPFLLEVSRFAATPLGSSSAPAGGSGGLEAQFEVFEPATPDSYDPGGITSPPAVVTLPDRPVPPVASEPTQSPPPTWSMPGPTPSHAPDSNPSVQLGNEHTYPVPYPVSVGPLPTRSAAPPGGVLAAGDPAPPIDPREAARADLALFDPTRGLHDDEFGLRNPVPVANPPAVPVLAAEGAPMVAVRGPGGLPLLATALIATSGQQSSPPQADLTPAADNAAEARPALVPTGAVSAACTSRSTSESLAAATPGQDRPKRDRRARRASALSGMSIAVALGVGLLLPDVVAAFQETPPSHPRLRFGPLRRRLPGRLP